MKINFFGKGLFSRRSKYNAFTGIFNKFISVKNNPDVAKDYTKFGWTAIIIALLSVVLVYPCFWLGRFFIFTLAFSNLGVFTYMILIGNIFIFVLGLIMFIFPVLMCFYSICFPIFQMIINRKKIGWISLIVVILCLILTVILAFYGLSALS